MKKLLCVIFTFILLTGAASAAYATTDTNAGTAGKSYTDVKSTNWAYESVNAMSEKGILKGYADGTFKPSNTVTYGEFIKMALIGATNEDIGNSASGNWAKSYYNKALELKYFGMTDIKAEQLNSTITRSDMALIISNILGDTKIDNYDTLDQSISDVNATTKNDYDIIKSYATGILTGYADGTFKPTGTLTRAEAVTVIYRLADESKRVIPSLNNSLEVKTNVNEVIQNSKSFLDDAKQIDRYLANVTCYRIVEDATPYNFILKQKYGNGINTTWFDSVNIGSAYLMKDNKIVEALSGSPYTDKTMGYIYHVDITKTDYIVSIPSDAYFATSGETVEALLIVNPFKE